MFYLPKLVSIVINKFHFLFYKESNMEKFDSSSITTVMVLMILNWSAYVIDVVPYELKKKKL